MTTCIIVAIDESNKAPRVLHSGSYNAMTEQLETYRAAGSELDWWTVKRLSLMAEYPGIRGTVRVALDSLDRPA